jgi:hypothetical protein
VSDVSRVKRVLLSLPDAGLRVGWLTEQLGRWPADFGARVLNGVLEQSEAADPDAREVLLTFAMVVIRESDRPLVRSLRQEARSQRLFSLDRLVRRARQPAAQAPPHDEQPVPDYGAGRELTLGERRSLARRPTRTSFEKLLADPHPMVIRMLLANPKMVEEDAVQLACRRPARVEVIREIARTHRWLSRARVRMAILHNPGSPPEVAVPLLGLCTRGQLREVAESTAAQNAVRAIARELLERRPPMKHVPGAERVLQ